MILSSSSPNLPPIKVGSPTNMTSDVLIGGKVDADGGRFFDVVVEPAVDVLTSLVLAAFRFLRFAGGLAGFSSAIGKEFILISFSQRKVKIF